MIPDWRATLLLANQKPDQLAGIITWGCPSDYSVVTQQRHAV